MAFDGREAGGPLKREVSFPTVSPYDRVSPPLLSCAGALGGSFELQFQWGTGTSILGQEPRGKQVAVLTIRVQVLKDGKCDSLEEEGGGHFRQSRQGRPLGGGDP